MATDGGAKSFRDFARRGSRRAKQRDELVPAGMCNQLSFTQIRPRQIENRAQHRLGVGLTKLVGKPSVVIDVGNEQRYRTPRRTRLGDRCRGGIDEGVVGSEPSLLIEKNEMLLQAGRPRLRASVASRHGAKSTVRAKGRMTQGKSRDLCHIAFIQASFHCLSHP